MVDVKATKEAWLDIKGQLEGEIAVVVVKGSVTDSNETIEAGQMLISKTDNECCVQLAADTQLLLFGGQPLPEPRYMFWNFVSSSRDRLKQASQDWENKLFPKVPNDHTYIPLPQRPSANKTK
jgi:redox-sensitive bicupin YhaK (pirin superfamily)